MSQPTAKDRRADKRAAALELVEPTDRQMFRVATRDPEIYNEIHRRLTRLSLAHSALFGDRGITAADVARNADALAGRLTGATEGGSTLRAAELVRRTLIPDAEAELPHTWETPLGRVLVMLGAYPDPWMPRVVAMGILGVSKQRVSQMVTDRLLAEGGAGILTSSLARLLAPA